MKWDTSTPCGATVSRRQPAMFIPGVGAIVRLRQLPANPVEDADWIGWPALGHRPALGCTLVFLATGSAFWVSHRALGGYYQHQ